MMINMTSELNDIHKKLLKEKITNELWEILMDKLQLTVRTYRLTQKIWRHHKQKTWEDTETTK
jgi:hypothetical protein